ncbi:MAG TPA: hypothetical protein PLY87_10070 [Planctomycetaceae bacterium]|nr:hypothetical protein [Planctomycetaceae bacterium]HQZ65412.1 hypothetical protein [Planctomycetaceae bacterium]
MGRRLNKLLGITKAKRKIAKFTGIPTTRSGRKAKAGRLLGCGLLIFAIGIATLGVAATCLAASM